VSYSDEDSDSLCECDGMDMKCTNPCHSRDWEGVEWGVDLTPWIYPFPKPAIMS
jgi:hypothetical protein